MIRNRLNLVYIAWESLLKGSGLDLPIHVEAGREEACWSQLAVALPRPGGAVRVEVQCQTKRRASEAASLSHLYFRAIPSLNLAAY